MQRMKEGTAMRIVAGIIGVILSMPSGWAAPAATETLRFAITRNGEQIGTHVIEVNRAGQETSVSVATDLTVKVLLVTAYHFQHAASERWVNDRLVALTATTDNNGTRHEVSVAMKASGLEMEADGKAARLDSDIMPGSLWNPELLRRSFMLDAQDGQVMPLLVVDDGMDELTINAHPVKARHYTLKSRYSQDVWYDDHQRLVQSKIIGSNGSIILYVPI